MFLKLQVYFKCHLNHLRFESLCLYPSINLFIYFLSFTKSTLLDSRLIKKMKLFIWWNHTSFGGQGFGLVLRNVCILVPIHFHSNKLCNTHTHTRNMTQTQVCGFTCPFLKKHLLKPFASKREFKQKYQTRTVKLLLTPTLIHNCMWWDVAIQIYCTTTVTWRESH